ncbi:MAG: sulfotransferase [Verrucomicrobia bacterium]|nr:sulfotransferase [Verrucomicrobiota bacterium]
MFNRRIIIGGLPRSGSTLFRFMLDSSSTILSGPETGFFQEPLSQLQARADRVAGRVAEKLELPEPVINEAIHSSQSLFQAFDAIMSAYAQSIGVNKTAWAEKTPRNCFAYPFLAAENPETNFISTIRHGLDVVTSIVDSSERKAGEYWVSIQRYRDCMRAIYSFKHPRHLIIRYEDLVAEPEQTLRRMMSFVDLPYEPAMIRDFNHPTSSRDLTKVTQPKLREPIQTSWIDRWNTPEHAARMKEFMADADAVMWLKHSGYAADSAG